jgi:cytochrome b561
MRYPLILRLIHWFTAIMFIPMLAGGYFWLRTMPSSDPFKLDALMYHMAIGVFLVALTLIRLLLRLRVAHPEASGLALWVHRALYACVFLMPVSGFTMVFSARLNDIVFARNGALLPADMATIPGHFWHGATALTLALLIALHIAGGIKDRSTIRRMI